MPHLVIARSTEPLDWLADVPQAWRITVHGGAAAPDDVAERPGMAWRSAPAALDASALMAHAVLDHLGAPADDGDDLTVFAPADPFAASPHLLALLAQAEHFAPVQPLACRSAGAPDRSRHDRRDWLGALPVRAERFSLATLAPLDRADEAALGPGRTYRRKHGLAEGENLLAHFLALAGLDALAAEAAQADLGCCAGGPVFAVDAAALAAARQRLRAHLPAWRVLLRADRNYPALMQRCWLHLFGLPFIALPGLGTSAAAHAPAAPDEAAAPAAPAMARVVAAIDAVLARATPAPRRALPVLTDAAPAAPVPATAGASLDHLRERMAQAMARGEVGLAWSLLDEGLARWPDAVPLLADAMALAYRQSDVERALHGAQRVLALEPDHLDALFTQGMCLASAGRADEAMDVLARLADHPQAALWQAEHPQLAQTLASVRQARQPA